jgi:hypothetical protein
MAGNPLPTPIARAHQVDKVPECVEKPGETGDRP